MRKKQQRNHVEEPMTTKELLKKAEMILNQVKDYNFDNEPIKKIGIDQLQICIQNVKIKKNCKRKLRQYLGYRYKSLIKYRNNITLINPRINLPQHVVNMHINNLDSHKRIVNQTDIYNPNLSIHITYAVKNPLTANLYNLSYEEYTAIISDTINFINNVMGLSAYMDDVYISLIEINKNYVLEKPMTQYSKHFILIHHMCINKKAKQKILGLDPDAKSAEDFISYHSRTSKSITDSAYQIKMYDKIAQLFSTHPKLKKHIKNDLNKAINQKSLVRFEFTLHKSSPIRKRLTTCKWTELSNEHIIDCYNREILIILDNYLTIIEKNTKELINTYKSQSKRHNLKELAQKAIEYKEKFGVAFIFRQDIFKRFLLDFDNKQKKPSGNASKTLKEFIKELKYYHHLYDENFIYNLLTNGHNIKKNP